jgi:hypothetical protein
VKTLLPGCLALLLIAACGAETPETTTETAPAAPAAPATAPEPAAPAAPTNENHVEGTWPVQVKIDAHGTSTLNYVGAESGDWMPIRFTNDSEAGKKILAACANDDLCEFTGAIEYLDEVPPENASAVSRLIRVDSVRKLPGS